MKNFTRGASIRISLTFRDQDGNVVQPTGANVTLSFVPKNHEILAPNRTFLTYALAQNTDPGTVDWVLDWDSSIAEPGSVFGHAVTTTPSVPVSAVDLAFRLTANRANKELFGDDL